MHNKRLDAVKIGKILRECRGTQTQETVANAIGITKMAISDYENGRRIPRDEIKLALSSYYKKTVEYLFFDNVVCNSPTNGAA